MNIIVANYKVLKVECLLCDRLHDGHLNLAAKKWSGEVEEVSWYQKNGSLNPDIAT